ncbi:hypothetical protein SODALDRAFT_330411 [Sodiomyces alkalinus F11]|uniref:Nuclear segregation protein n=1 Tax=Sodiomyces alkalinus (strain CBS 110278 / VKM F-3762 / F11) TaxID=1314773 RepID=A0A3N2Q1P6_SODAK|nr:hypothetical protein SODALDRAFT_330411 [Sodiomyces alkalinus F11]ROT40670.1 hypothetical protein SODALDRAFT_330411 [Sodiomyces alkalinus F11]
MADTKKAAAAESTDAKSGRPAMPDEAAYQQKLKAAEAEHKKSMDKLAAIRAKIDLAMPSKDKEKQSPTQKRRQELIAQANEIRQKQGAGKNARAGKLDQIKRLDEQLRSRINEQKMARSKAPFKNIDELDRQVDSLEAQVNSGTMKIVDEKKALAEMSSLKKQRKNFSQFEEAEKQIDDLKAKIKEIKDSMDDPEAKAMSEQYSKIQAELDQIKAESDEAYKNLSALRDERTRLQAEQQEKYQAIRQIKDEYWQQKKAAQAHEREARDKARERRKAEQERYVLERKKAEAERLLAEASEPAYLDEIRRANSLLLFLDPSAVKTEKAPLLANRGLGAQPERKVDDANIQGTKLPSKKDREDEYLPAVKKGKKGKKGGAAAATAAATASSGSDSGKFNCPPSVVEDCAFMGIDPPMSAADVSPVAEKVKAKLAHWQEDQAAETQRNIEKAKKKIEQLEAEEAKANAANGTDDTKDVKEVNGNDDKAVEEVTKDLKETTVEEGEKA